MGRYIKEHGDIHSLHEEPLAADAVIDRRLSRMTEPVNCQLSILDIANRQQRASGDRMSAMQAERYNRAAAALVGKK